MEDVSANSAIYLPCKGVDLRDIFGADAKVHASSEGSIEAFKVKIGGDDCIFNILPENEIAKHVAGFKFYISSLEETEERKGDARMAVEQAETILGLVVNSYVTNEPVSVLRSTSAAVDDFWSVSGQSYPTTGGATQLFSPQKQSFILIRGN